jgi:hypothetical protein
MSEQMKARLTELETKAEPLGTEQRVIDNSSSTVSVKRQFSVEHEGPMRCEIDFQNKLVGRQSSIDG